MADSGGGESAGGGGGRINGAVDKDAHRAPIVPGGEMVPLVQRYVVVEVTVFDVPVRRISNLSVPVAVTVSW